MVGLEGADTLEQGGVALGNLCCLNSSLFYWFITVFSDCRHVNKREISYFPVNLVALANGPLGKKLADLAVALMEGIRSNSEYRKLQFHHDSLTVQCVFPGRSKDVIDEIDRIMGTHFGFTAEEVDFIINYDIKYRLGLRALDPAVGALDVRDAELVDVAVEGVASAGVPGPRSPGT